MYTCTYVYTCMYRNGVNKPWSRAGMNAVRLHKVNGVLTANWGTGQNWIPWELMPKKYNDLNIVLPTGQINSIYRYACIIMYMYIVLHTLIRISIGKWMQVVKKTGWHVPYFRGSPLTPVKWWSSKLWLWTTTWILSYAISPFCFFLLVVMVFWCLRIHVQFSNLAPSFYNHPHII